MEEGVIGLRGKHLIVRTAAFFSPHDTYNFASAVASSLSRGDPFRAAHDLVVTPTYVPHLVGTALDLLIDEETGVWHLTNEAPLSWAAFAARIAERLGLPDRMLQPVRGAELGFRAERPAFAALRTIRGSPLLSIDAALADFASHYTSHAPILRSVA
jgi:dTDP-4-dehydrorhamnose reductase